MPVDGTADNAWATQFRLTVMSQMLTRLTLLPSLRALTDDPSLAELRGRVEDQAQSVRDNVLRPALWRNFNLTSRALAAGLICFLRRISDVGLEWAAGEADELKLLNSAHANLAAEALLLAPFAHIPGSALHDGQQAMAETVSLLRPIIIEAGGKPDEIAWLQRPPQSIDLADHDQLRGAIEYLIEAGPFHVDPHGLLLYALAWQGSCEHGDEELQASALESVAVCAVRSGGSPLARDWRLGLLRQVVVDALAVIRSRVAGPLVEPAAAVVVEYAAHMLPKAEEGRRYYAREAARLLQEVDAACVGAHPGLRCRFLELAMLAEAHSVDPDDGKTKSWVTELAMTCTTMPAIKAGWHPGAAAASLCGVAEVLARRGSVASARKAWDFTGVALELLQMAENAKLEGDRDWYAETRGRMLSTRSEIALRHDESVSDAALQELYEAFSGLLGTMFRITGGERRILLVADILFALKSPFNPGTLETNPARAGMIGALVAGLARVVAVQLRRNRNIDRDAITEVYHLFRLATEALETGGSTSERLQVLIDRGDAFFDIGLLPHGMNSWSAAVKLAIESPDRDVFQPVSQPFAPALAGVFDRMAVGYVLARDPGASLQVLELVFGLRAQRWLAARDAAPADPELTTARDMMRAELLGKDHLAVLGLGQDVVIGRAMLAEAAGQTVGERILKDDWFPRAQIEAELAAFAEQVNGLLIVFITAASGCLVISVLEQSPQAAAADQPPPVQRGLRLETQSDEIGYLFQEAQDWRHGICGPATEHATALLLSMLARMSWRTPGTLVAAPRGWLAGLPFDIAAYEMALRVTEAGQAATILDGISFAPGRIALADACRLARDARKGADILHLVDPDAGFAFADVESTLLDHACHGHRTQLNGRSALEALLNGGFEQPILHISCHGLHEPNDPDASFLRLGHDAILHPRLALGALDLRGTRVVFLSACHTAELSMMSPDSYYGLAQSLMLSGAPAVVATRWAVDERAALLVASRFYENLATSPPGEALHETKTWLRGLEAHDAATWLRERGIADKRIAEILQGGRNPAYPKGFAPPPAPEPKDIPGRTEDHRPFSAAQYWGAFILFGV